MTLAQLNKILARAAFKEATRGIDSKAKFRTETVAATESTQLCNLLRMELRSHGFTDAQVHQVMLCVCVHAKLRTQCGRCK